MCFIFKRNKRTLGSKFNETNLIGLINIEKKNEIMHAMSVQTVW